VSIDFNSAQITEPPKIIAPHDVVIANQSDSVELLCECRECLPIINFTWTAENQLPFRSYFVENSRENSFRSVLEINNVSEAHGGSFECSMHNKLGHDKVLIELLVQTSPKIEAILINDDDVSKRDVGLETVHVLEGESLSVECVVDAFPEPSVFWAKSGQKYVEDSFLEIKKVSLDDDGEYECITENSLGTTKRMIQIDVNYAPRRKRHADTDLEFKEKSRVTLDCNLIGNPTPVIAWFKNSREMPENERHVLSEDGRILQFEAQADDNGIYECKGANVHGNSSIEFTVIILGEMWNK
jgi:hypothetical protein